MLKKLLATTLLLLAVMLTSCAGKESKYTVDGVIDKVLACDNIQELIEFAADKELNEYVESLPEEDQTKILKMVEVRSYQLTLQASDDELDEIQDLMDEKLQGI